MEFWKNLENSRYAVSSLGRIKNIQTGRHLAITYDASGYGVVTLYDPYKRSVRVHRLVGELFINNPDGLPVLNHKNGIKTDASSSNLEWVTHSQNTKHAYDTGLKARGESVSWAKLTDTMVENIKLDFVAGRASVEIAIQYGIAEGSVSNIRAGRSWKHIRPDLVWDIPIRNKSTRKLCVEDIPTIRQMFVDGLTDTVIANKYSVNRGTIFQIRCGKNWKNY